MSLGGNIINLTNTVTDLGQQQVSDITEPGIKVPNCDLNHCNEPVTTLKVIDCLSYTSCNVGLFLITLCKCSQLPVRHFTLYTVKNAIMIPEGCTHAPSSKCPLLLTNKKCNLRRSKCVITNMWHDITICSITNTGSVRVLRAWEFALIFFSRNQFNKKKKDVLICGVEYYLCKQNWNCSVSINSAITSYSNYSRNCWVDETLTYSVTTSV